MKVGHSFTLRELMQDLQIARISVTEGALSGFLSRAVTREVFGYVDNGVARTYTYLNPAALEEMNIRPNASAGSVTGRGDGPHKSRRRPTAKVLSERLMAIAADIELLQLDLRAVSTKDLLSELTRRAKEEETNG